MTAKSNIKVFIESDVSIVMAVILLSPLITTFDPELSYLYPM